MDTKTKIWPAANERGMNWTAKYPRPTADNGHHPSVVKVRQEEWDAGDARRVKYARRTDAPRAERETKEQERRDAAEAKATDRREAQRAGDEVALKRRFLAAGGSDEEWTKERETVIAEHRRRQIATAETADDRARRAQAAMMRQTF